MAEPQVLIGLAKEICEYIVHEFGRGNLTTDGVQVSSTVVTATATDWTAAETITVDPTTSISGYGYPAPILEVEFNLVGYVANANTSPQGGLKYKWQAKDYGLSSTCWVDLCTEWSTLLDTQDDTYWQISRSGYFTTTTNFENVPFQVRLLFMGIGSATPAMTTQVKGKTSSLSQIRVVYKVQ